jgi:hypothetical protein
MACEDREQISGRRPRNRMGEGWTIDVLAFVRGELHVELLCDNGERMERLVPAEKLAQLFRHLPVPVWADDEAVLRQEANG